jgi:hypothetical protein
LIGEQLQTVMQTRLYRERQRRGVSGASEPAHGLIVSIGHKHDDGTTVPGTRCVIPTHLDGDCPLVDVSRYFSVFR